MGAQSNPISFAIRISKQFLLLFFLLNWKGLHKILVNWSQSPHLGRFCRLALSSCLGKPYHQIKASRMNKFMVDNGYINTSHKKPSSATSTDAWNT